MNAEKLNAVYNQYVSNLVKNASSEEEALRRAIGQEFVAVGRLEFELLRSEGLAPEHAVADVGCGSGRLAYPLSFYLGGGYHGFDIVPDLVDHARRLVSRPDWDFRVTDGSVIPLPDDTADFVCFFSVFTHLFHEDIFRYLREARRALKPGGKLVFSFIEFKVMCHWFIFEHMLQVPVGPERVHNQFISRDAIEVWAQKAGFQVARLFDGDIPHIPLPEPVRWDDDRLMEKMGNLGQSVAVLVKA
jgi:SAM-dependent methyltransferase